MAQHPYFTKVNASIKAAFRDRPGFVPVKADVFGTFASLRFEGDLPVSLLTDIAKHVEANFPEFASTPATRVMNYQFGGSVINWYRNS
jgi:hypothetical protein